VGRNLLLLLDTCDAHLTAIAPVVTRLLAAGNGIRVLTTSREPLGTLGELVWRIPPMSLKPPTDADASDAVALLLDRASAARGARRLSSAEQAHQQRAAARLDGLPLALELAAARLRLFSAAQLADRLDDLLGTLDAGGPNTAEYPIVSIG